MSAIERAAELAPCTCHEAYTGRRLRDPNCCGCEVRDTVEELADEGHVVTDEIRNVLHAAIDLSSAVKPGSIETCLSRVRMAVAVYLDSKGQTDE